jgi:hypothetical protein
MISIDEFYAKLTQKQKILFLTACLFFLLALMDRMVLGPIIAQLKIYDAQIWAKQESLRRNLRVLSFKDSILKDYSQYELYLDSGEKTQEEIVSALLNMIETLARKYEINISNIQPGDVTENPLYKEYLTSIECEGKEMRMLAFMDALEASDFLFKILKYQFVVKNKTGEIIKANIDISRILIRAERIPGHASPVGKGGLPSEEGGAPIVNAVAPSVPEIKLDTAVSEGAT